MLFAITAMIALSLSRRRCGVLGIRTRRFREGFPGILSNFVSNMRTYNGIERPDFTPERISELKADEVFVFGSNLAGRHDWTSWHRNRLSDTWK